MESLLLKPSAVISHSHSAVISAVIIQNVREVVDIKKNFFVSLFFLSSVTVEFLIFYTGNPQYSVLNTPSKFS